MPTPHPSRPRACPANASRAGRKGSPALCSASRVDRRQLVILRRPVIRRAHVQASHPLADAVSAIPHSIPQGNCHWWRCACQSGSAPSDCQAKSGQAPFTQAGQRENSLLPTGRSCCFDRGVRRMKVNAVVRAKGERPSRSLSEHRRLPVPLLGGPPSRITGLAAMLLTVAPVICPTGLVPIWHSSRFKPWFALVVDWRAAITCAQS